jgi:transcriptional regulator with XRE-family HTH domain
MGATFAESLKSLRTARGLSQQQLAIKLFVDRSTVARWELGDRKPDLAVIARIAKCLDVDAATLLNAVQESETPEIIVVDDERVALSGAIAVLEDVFPEAAITGFIRPSDALAYAQAHPITIAFLDVEIGQASGLDLCRALLERYPRTNVVFLTAHREYSFDAWGTGACGFLLKPITAEAVRVQIDRLRYPVAGLLTPMQKASRDQQQTAQE